MIESFDRPDANLTGISTLDVELGPKRLEVFRELVPGLHRVLFAYDANDALGVAAARLYREAVHRLGMMLVEQTMQTQAEAQATLTQVRKGEVDGILVQPYGALNIHGFIVDIAGQQGIPTMFSYPTFVDRSEGLASYGSYGYAAGWQAVRLVDKIFKRTKPAEIPVEVSAKVEFPNSVGQVAGRVFFLVDKHGIVRGKWIGEQLDVFPNEVLLKGAQQVAEKS